MADIGLLTVNVVVKRRPLWKQLLWLPLTCHRHYAIMRRSGHGLIVSAYGAWVLAGVTVTFGTGKR